MYIKDNTRAKHKFCDIDLGAVFVFHANYFMKLMTVYSVETNSSVNAVDIESGAFADFSLDCQVEVPNSAELFLE